MQSERVFRTAVKKKSEIARTKELCYDITQDVLMLDKKDSSIAERELKYRITKDIISPLSDLLETPVAKLNSYVLSFLRDSTLIAGLISCLSGFDKKTVITAVAASAISNGIKILDDRVIKKKGLPSTLLLDGLKSSSKHFIEYSLELEKIRISRNPF